MSELVRILVVDDDRRMAGTLVDILRAEEYDAEAAYSGREALDRIKESREEGALPFGCVLTDVKMPEMNGVELHSAIKAIDPRLPVVMMTAYATDALVDEAIDSGALASLSKPLDIHMLLSFFSTLSKECSVVIVDDDPAFCKTMGDILRVRGFAVDEVTDPNDWDENIKAGGQIVLLDMKLNGVSGLDILKQIREKHPFLPVILVTGYGREMAAPIQAALEIDAYACLHKPLEIESLLGLLADLRRRDLGRILGRPAITGK